MLIVALAVTLILSLVAVLVRSTTLMGVSAITMIVLLVELLIAFGNFVATTTGAPPEAFYTVFAMVLIYIGILLLIAVG